MTYPTRDELEAVFQTLGLQAKSSRSGHPWAASATMTQQVHPWAVPSEEHEALPPAPTGFMSQLGHGIISPVRTIGGRWFKGGPSPAPKGVGGWAGSIVGNVIGWGLMAAITAATLGKVPAALAATGVGGSTAGAAVLKGGAAAARLAPHVKTIAGLTQTLTTGMVLDAASGWGQQESLEDIAKRVRRGALFSLALFGAGQAWKHIGSPVAQGLLEKRRFLRQEALDKALVAKTGRPEILAQHRPDLVKQTLTGAPPKWTEQVFERVSQAARRYNIDFADPKIPYTEKVQVLSDLVSNPNVDPRLTRPLFRSVNDILLHGNVAKAVSKYDSAGLATAPGRVPKDVIARLKNAPPNRNVVGWASREELVSRKLKQLAYKYRKELNLTVPRKEINKMETETLLALFQEADPAIMLEVRSSLSQAVPLDQMSNLWSQFRAVNKQIGYRSRAIHGILEKYNAKNLAQFENAVKNKLQQHGVTIIGEPQDLQDMPKELVKEVLALRKDYQRVRNHLYDLEHLDGIRSQLAVSAEPVLNLPSSRQIMSLINEKMPKDPNRIYSEYLEYAPEIRKWMQKHQIYDLAELKDKPHLRGEIRNIMRELRNQGKKPVEIHLTDYIKPTELEKTLGKMRGAAIAKERPFTSYDEYVLARPAGILERWITPGRGNLTEPVLRQVRTARYAHTRFVDQYLGKVADIIGRDKLGRVSPEIRAYRKRLTLYLENPKLMDTDGVSAEVRKTVQELREVFNLLHKDFGIEGRIENYVPHIAKIARNPDIDLSKVPKELRFFAEMTRSGNIMDREMDIFRLFQIYINAGAKKKFYQPLFDRLDPIFLGSARKKGKDAIVHYSRQAYYENLKLRLLGRPVGSMEHAMDQVLDDFLPRVAKTLLDSDVTGRHTQAIAAFMSELAYAGTLGYNPFSAIKNLTQQILAVAHLDPNPMVGVDYFLRTKKWLATRHGREFVIRHNLVRNDRMPREALDLANSRLERIPGLGKLHKHAFTLFRKADQNNIDTAWAMQYLYQLDKGVTPWQAAEAAYTFTMATQFMYGIDSPALYWTPLGKLAGVLMSWPLNYANLIREAGSQKQWAQVVTGLAAYAFASEALSLTGLSFRSIHPVEVAKGYLPIALTHEDNGISIPMRVMASSGRMLFSLLEGDPEARERAWDNLKRSASTMIPYYTASKRVLSTLEAARRDWKLYDERGRLRHELDGQDSFLYRVTGMPTEALLQMIGPTTAARYRWEALEDIKREEHGYRRARALTIDAFLEGDYEKFLNRMEQLLAVYGTQVDIADIWQEIELRQQTAIERRASSLPPGVRARFK